MGVRESLSAEESAGGRSPGGAGSPHSWSLGREGVRVGRPRPGVVSPLTEPAPTGTSLHLGLSLLYT